MISLNPVQYPGYFPDNLQILDTTTISTEECRTRHHNISPEFVNDDMICTLNPIGQGVCDKDSGGGLVIGKYVVGVVSSVVPCGVEYLDVFARVSSNFSWIISESRD